MAYDFNQQKEVSSQIFDPEKVLYSNYVERGYLQTGNNTLLTYIRRLMGLSASCEFEPLFSNGMLQNIVLHAISPSQYCILLTFNCDLTKSDLVLLNAKKGPRAISRPVLVFNQENLESQGNARTDMVSDNSIYKFMGLGCFKLADDGKHVIFEKIGDYCNLPIQ